MKVRIEEVHNGSGVVKIMISGNDKGAVEAKVEEYRQTYPAMGYGTWFRPLKVLVGIYMQSGTRNSS